MIAQTKKNVSFALFFPFVAPLIGVNTIISLLILLPIFLASYRGPFLFNVIPFAAHSFLLNLAAGIPITVLSLFGRRRGLLATGIAPFLLLQTLLLIDTRIYMIFHFHINALVLNVITTEGAGDSVILGTGTILSFLGVLSLIAVAEVVLAFMLLKRADVQRYSHILARTAKGVLVGGILLIALDKGIYAYGDLMNNTTITKSAKLYPLYQPLTVKHLALNVFKFEVNRETDLKLETETGAIRYPKRPVTFDTLKDRGFNILFIVIDGLRFDMLTPDVMPNTWKFSREALVYRNHYSGGNGTRFGLFTLFYGIHGSYWHNFLAHRTPPVLIDTLIDKDYEFRILSSTRLTFPEFRKTAFLRIPDSVRDTFTTGDSPERDRILTEDLTDYLSRWTTDKPFFAFLFYNSSHQPFQYPQEFERFKPVGPPEINYFTTIGKEQTDLIRNRYKNALLSSDHLVGNLLNVLREKRLMDRTIVIICGDHGEEFYEDGSFGHTSSFNDYQLKTVFVMRHPDAGASVVDRLTSHLDVVPTLMESLGAVSPASDYSQGISLLSARRHDYVTGANWDTAALIDDRNVIVFSTETYNLGSFEVREKGSYTEIPDDSRVLKDHRSALLDMTHRMSEFYGDYP